MRISFFHKVIVCLLIISFIPSSLIYASDELEWISLPAGDDTGIKFGTSTAAQSVAYGNGTWVAVGNAGMASYSTDGINWTSLPAGTDTGIKFGTSSIAQSVAYGNGMWVVVGNAGMASYSTDGINWTALTPGTDTGIKFGTTIAQSVAYGNGMWVVVGRSGMASYSTDGINWTSLPAGDSTGIKFGTTMTTSVKYGDDKWIVVGRSGKASYSSDGISWTALTPGDSTGIKFGTINANDIEYGGGKWIVMGNTASTNKVSYSTDGINWTSLNYEDLVMGYNTPYSMNYGNGIWIATANNGNASYSSDGINWTSFPAGDDTGVKFGNSASAYDIEYGDGLFVAVGVSGKASYTYALSPSVSTSLPTSVSQNGSIMLGTITDKGGGNLISRGFLYGLTSTYTATSSESGDFDEGEFSATISGLSCGTTYHYKAFAQNHAGTSYGSDQTFTTDSCASGNEDVEKISGKRSSAPSISSRITTIPKPIVDTKDETKAKIITTINTDLQKAVTLLANASQLVPKGHDVPREIQTAFLALILDVSMRILELTQ